MLLGWGDDGDESKSVEMPKVLCSSISSTEPAIGRARARARAR